MGRFAKGHRPDSRDYGYPSHHGLIAASPPLLEVADHRRFRSGLLWQDNIGMCTGQAMSRACQLWYAANGYGAEILISGLFAYGVGRAQEYAGQDPDTAPPLEDIGAEPGLVLQASQNVGILLRDDYPGPESTNFDRSLTNARPSPDALVRAYDGRGLQFSEVTPAAGDRMRDAIRALMVRRIPVEFAMFVDTAFEYNEGQVIESIDQRDPEGGGHMLTILDASDDEYVDFDNWWKLSPEQAAILGKDPVAWGLDDGTGRMSWPCFERYVQQVLAVKAVPLVRKAA